MHLIKEIKTRKLGKEIESFYDFIFWIVYALQF